MKLVRWIGIILIALVLLVVAAAIILPLVIDPNDYKDDITAAVKEQTGRELTIEGDLKLSVFPWLGVEMGALRLSNAPGFGDQPFASLQGAEVRVMLLPLLKKKLEASTVVLNGLSLNLGKATDGRTNWDDMIKPSASEADIERKDGKEQVGLAALAIGGVRIQDANIVWDDRQAKQRYEVADLNLTLGAIYPGEPVDFDLAVKLAASEPQLDGAVKLSGVLGFSNDLKKFDVTDVVLKANARGAALPTGALDAKVTTAASVDLDQQTLTIPSLIAEVMDLTVKLNVEGKNIQGNNPSFSGKLTLDEFVPRELLKTLKVELPEMSDPTVLGKAGVAMNYAATTSSADLSSINIRFDDSALTGSLAVKDFAKQSLRFDLVLDQIDLDRYLPPQKEGEVQAAPTPAEAAAAGAGSLPMETLRALDLAGTLRINKLKAYQLHSTDVRVTLNAKDGIVRVHPAAAKLYQGEYSGDITLNAQGKQPRIALNEKLSSVQAGPLLKDMTGEEKLLGRADISANLTATGVDPKRVQKTLNGNIAFGFHDGAIKGVNLAEMIRQAKAKLGKPVATQQSGPNQTDFSQLTGTAVINDGVVTNNDLKMLSPLLRVDGNGVVNLPAQSINYKTTIKIVDSLKGQGGKDLKDLEGLAIPLKYKCGFADKPTSCISIDLEDAAKEVVKKKVKEKLGDKEDELKKKLEDKIDDKLKDQLKGLFR